MDVRELAGTNSDSKGRLVDAYINYKVMDELQFLAGQTKVKYPLLISVGCNPDVC